MKVTDLTREQLQQLKCNYLAEQGRELSWGECIEVDDIVSDEEIFNEYDSADFMEEDFL